LKQILDRGIRGPRADHSASENPIGIETLEGGDLRGRDVDHSASENPIGIETIDYRVEPSCCSITAHQKTQ